MSYIFAEETDKDMKKMLICESGATKADWRVVENGRQTVRVLSEGINVSTMPLDAVESRIRKAAQLLPETEYDDIHFYIAGVVTPPIRSAIENILKTNFRVSEVEVQNDLTGAARAACGHEPGIAAIMGTGSNSCYWDGQNIALHIKSGGFILGDDGSASVLGRLFISDFIKGLVPEEIAEEYSKRFPSEYPEIVELVYHNPDSPSAWLGSLCPFILSFYGHPYVKRLVDNHIQAFVDRSLKQYDIEKYPVGIIGGFGNALKDIIRPIFEESGIRIRAFIPDPVEELIRYHSR